MGHVAVGGAQDGRDARRIEAVLKVVGNQLVCGRDGDCAQLVQRQHHGPELPVALEHHQHAVAALDAQGAEVVHRLRGQALHVHEAEAALVLVHV